ncbi:MAG: hypothetical protein AAFR76_09860 [Planctomycetota bacterium]
MSRRARTARAVVLVAALLGGIALIEINRLFGEGTVLEHLPTVHLAAISWAIYLLLIFEFVEMAFAMSNSVASSVGRHLQLYSLVLLRDAFLKLSEFPEPIDVGMDDLYNVGVMTSDAAGAVVLFLAATVFARMQLHRPIASDVRSRDSFKAFKQVMVLLLLGTLVSLCAYRLIAFVAGVPAIDIIDTFFTVLVFVDVLLAFASLAVADNPAIVFRNFGFAFAAILLRLSLASPEFIRPGLGLAGAAVALTITLVYNLDIRANEALKEDVVDKGGGGSDA